MERDYTIPLRQVLKAPRLYRTPKAVKEVREFIEKHMKTKEVLLGESLNKFLWKDGITNVPNKVKIHALKDKDGVVYVDLPGLKIVTRAEREKAEEDHIKAREELKKEKDKARADKEAEKSKEEKKVEKLDLKPPEVN